MIHKLEFLNNVHDVGVNVTVRRGLKWAGQVSKFDIVNVARTGESPTFQARIEGVVTCQFFNIPDDMLTFEHDPTCRSYEGLADCMAKTYPGFHPSDTVTILFYEIIDAKGQD